MLELQDSVNKLADFKHEFAQKYGIKKLGIFGSVARKENTEDSDIDIVVEVNKPSLKLMYIKLKDRTWMYLRVEFPRELTWAVDPLLHYVKDYEPKNENNLPQGL